MTSQSLCNHFHGAKDCGFPKEKNILLLHVCLNTVNHHYYSRRLKGEYYETLESGVGRITPMFGELLPISSKFLMGGNNLYKSKGQLRVLRPLYRSVCTNLTFSIQF